jgi:branched-subunit amino acid ABC-type transport system permease component
VSARRGNSSPQQPTRTSVVGYLLTVVLYLGTVLVFGLARNWFTAHGHDVAAIAMFTFIIANVWLNAINLHFTRKDATGSAPVVNPYTVIGVLMIAAVVVTTVLGLVAHWAYWKLALEASLIALFAVFWVLQTIELWDQGLRQEALPSAPRATEEASPARTR